MNTLATQDSIRQLIESSKGKIFSVCFTKKDGTDRVMVGKLGVKKHLKGGDSTTAHLRYLITCFDMQKGAYRSINLETVKWVKLGGTVYEVPGDLSKQA